MYIGTINAMREHERLTGQMSEIQGKDGLLTAKDKDEVNALLEAHHKFGKKFSTIIQTLENKQLFRLPAILQDGEIVSMDEW